LEDVEVNGTPIEHLFSLQRSPYILAPVIHRFYEASPPRERDILLSYLVLPIVLYPPMAKFLMGANRKSSIRTMCNQQSRLVGLDSRVRDFKSLTNASILILTAERGIEIDESLTVRSVGKVKSESAKRDLIDASQKLASIFADIDVVSIYRTLGLKSL
jgi:hypothetical protein